MNRPAFAPSGERSSCEVSSSWTSRRVPSSPGTDCPAAEAAQDGLAAYVHRAVAANVPRQYEDLSEWGATIPAPAAVRFPRLKRTVIKVGDRYEVPHGTWKRTKVWLEEPAKDLRIRVPEVRRVGKQTTRLRVEATAAVRAERERQQWVKGVRRGGSDGRGRRRRRGRTGPRRDPRVRPVAAPGGD